MPTDRRRLSSIDRTGFRKIDILCNCAGVAVRKDIVELTEDEWDLALDVTLKGIYLLSRELVPHMIRSGGGSIINIGSGWSLKGGPRAAFHCAAKVAVTVNLTRAMAIDHGVLGQHPRELRVPRRCRHRSRLQQRMRPAW